MYSLLTRFGHGTPRSEASSFFWSFSCLSVLGTHIPVLLWADNPLHLNSTSAKLSPPSYCRMFSFLVAPADGPRNATRRLNKSLVSFTLSPGFAARRAILNTARWMKWNIMKTFWKEHTAEISYALGGPALLHGN
jgi:hypothetical protein